MLKIFVCVSILVAVVGADYNFQDSDFNELLFDDLTSEADDDFLEPQRFRRGADNETDQNNCHRKKGKKERDSHCCSGEKANSEELEAMKEVKKNCIAEVRGESADDASYDPLNCDGVQAIRQQMVCAAECMAKKFDLLAENGDLQRDVLLTHTRKVIGDNIWKASVLEEYVDKCLVELKASKELKNNDDTKNPGCSPYPLEFHHCIWREFVQGCPAESQIDSKKCKKIRARLASGDISYADKTFKRLFRPHHKRSLNLE